MNDTIVEVERADLVYMARLLDSAFGELSDPDGDPDSALIDVDEALSVIEDYLK